jgi:hypothetical protein
VIAVERQREQGSALIIALAFIAVFGLVIAAVLSFSEAGIRTTDAVRSARSLSYAADGATEMAINTMRTSNADCTATYPTLTPAINNTPVQVTADKVDGTTTCQFGLSGTNNVNNTPGKALQALAVGSEDGIVQGSNSTLNVTGDIFSGTRIRMGGAHARLAVTGRVDALGACDPGNNNNQNPISSTQPPLHCSNTGGGANPADAVDPNYPTETPNLTHQTVPGLNPATGVFTCPTGWLVQVQPGYYDDAASLTKVTGGTCKNKVLLFNPGVYYFDFDFTLATECASNPAPCTWTINDSANNNNPATGTNVVAGIPKGWSTTAATRPTIPASPCMTLGDGASAGVQFIFGGRSQVNVAGGSVEVCPPPNVNSQQISVYGYHGPSTAQSASLSPTGSVPVPLSPPPGNETVFQNPSNAYAIGTPVLTADANPIPTTNPTAGLTLTGFNQTTIPSGARLESGILRIAHKESTQVTTLKATVTPASGSPVITITSSSGAGCDASTTLCLNTTPSLVENDIDLRPLGITSPAQLVGAAVKYEATIATGKNATAGSANLDGIGLTVNYTPVGLEPLQGCLVATPYVTNGSTCANNTPRALVTTSGSGSNFILDGTLYAPTAVIDVNMTSDARVFGRGVIARAIHVAITPSSSSAVGVYDPTPNSGQASSSAGPGTRIVLFTACAPQAAGAACPSSQAYLRAKVLYDDVHNTVSVTSWNAT